MIRIVVVIPVYREAANLERLHKRLEDVTRQHLEFSWEYLFVNDGSPDDSIEVLRALSQSDRKVAVIDLSRNFGKEIALTAGVHHSAHADAVICMDADLQHPPEVIPELLREWQGGAEIVATVRVSIEKQPLLRRAGSYLYYWLMARISGLDMVSQTTDFRLYDKKVVEAFCLATERERMFRGIMDWLGFRKVYVPFRAEARLEGVAGYSYVKLWRLAVNSITSFSLLPLRLTGYLGVLITLCSGLLLAWMLVEYIFTSSHMYTPLAIVVVANTFLIGIVLMAIGLVALYIGTIHTEVVNRPLYVVRECTRVHPRESAVSHGPGLKFPAEGGR
jgi:dolichol-phosphate mannosyltransferase